MKESSIESIIEGSIQDEHENRNKNVSTTNKNGICTTSNINILKSEKYHQIYQKMLALLENKIFFVIPSPEYHKALSLSTRLASENDIFYFLNFIIYKIQDNVEDGIFQIIKSDGYFKYIGAVNAFELGLFSIAGSTFLKCYNFFVTEGKDDLEIHNENYEKWKRDEIFCKEYEDTIQKHLKKSIKVDILSIYTQHCSEWSNKKTKKNLIQSNELFFELKFEILQKSLLCYKKLQMTSTASLVNNKILILLLKYGRLEDALKFCDKSRDSCKNLIEKIIANEPVTIEQWNLENILLNKEVERRKNGEYDLL